MTHILKLTCEISCETVLIPVSCVSVLSAPCVSSMPGTWWAELPPHLHSTSRGRAGCLRLERTCTRFLHDLFVLLVCHTSF